MTIQTKTKSSLKHGPTASVPGGMGQLVPATKQGVLVRALSPRPVTIRGKHVRGADDDDDLAGLPVDTRSPVRLGLWVLVLGFGGFLLFAGLVPLEEGVPSPGVVSIDTKRKAVQHLSGGRVKAVFVKEGQIVAEGDPVLEIDAASAQASYESARSNYYTLRATESRLIAEQNGSAAITWAPELLAANSEPDVAAVMRAQEGLLQSRRSALKNEIASMRASIAASNSQLESLRETINGTKSLVDEGFAPRNNLLELERQATELSGNISSTSLRISQREQEYRRDADAQLADVRGKVEAEGERFNAQKIELEHTILRAPASGQVVGLTTQSVGAIIAPGQKVMDIVPRDEPLVLETQIPPDRIDRVRAGQSVDVRFNNFRNSPMLVVPGEVMSVSGDLIANEQTGAAYYLARVKVTDEGVKKLGKNRVLQAGMPVEVIVKGGERTLLTYLLHPLTKRISVSMKEE